MRARVVRSSANEDSIYGILGIRVLVIITLRMDHMRVEYHLIRMRTIVTRRMVV
jgi:hypothetical protein